MAKHRPGDFVLVQVSADKSIIGQIRHIHDFIAEDDGDGERLRRQQQQPRQRRRLEAEVQWFWSCGWFFPGCAAASAAATTAAPKSTFHPSELIRDHSARLDRRVDMTKITAKCAVLYLPAGEDVPHDETGLV